MFGLQPITTIPKNWRANKNWLWFGWTPNIWLARSAAPVPLLFLPNRWQLGGGENLRQQIGNAHARDFFKVDPSPLLFFFFVNELL
jgi:hypothetical protein